MEKLLSEVKRILRKADVTVANVNTKLSLVYYKLANTELTDALKEHTMELSKLWIDILNNGATLGAVNISGTYNSLSKLDILGKKWSKDQQNNFKALIVKLAEKGKGISEEFNSQNIANILNALSKWNVLNTKIWEDDKKKLKDLVIKLAEKGSAISEEFNSQDIANTLNALSKWDVLDSQEFGDSKSTFKALIIKLIEQGDNQSTQFNSQNIANILNALSKWDIKQFKGAKEFVVNLIEQGSQSAKEFSSQEIASSYDALYKFNVFNNRKWNDDQLKGIKNFIVKLAEEGKEVYREFDSQGVANTFNAFSKLDVLNDGKWTSEEQEKLKSFVVQLAEVGSDIKGYSLKGIAKIYSAILKWNPDEFKSFTAKLAEQVQAIVQKQSEEDNILDNIRFTSQIITDLPGLKLKKLITDDGQLLVHLMQCLSTNIDKSEDSDLNKSWPKEDIVSALEGFTNIVNGLDNESSLKGKFDDSLIKILKKVFAVELDSGHIDKISEVVNKLIGSGVIMKKARDELLQKKQLLVDRQLTEKSQATDKSRKKIYGRQVFEREKRDSGSYTNSSLASNLNHNTKERKEDNQLTNELLTTDLSNQVVATNSARQVNSLQNDEIGYNIRKSASGSRSNQLPFIGAVIDYVKDYLPWFSPCKQATGTEHPKAAQDGEIVEKVEQIISEMVELEKLNIDFQQMKKKIKQRISKGKFDDITTFIKSYILDKCPGNLKRKFKTARFSKKIDGAINPLIQKISESRDSKLEVSDKEQQISFWPKSYLNDTSIQGHLIQDRGLRLN